MYLRETHAEPAAMLAAQWAERVIRACGLAVLLIGVWRAPSGERVIAV